MTETVQLAAILGPAAILGGFWYLAAKLSRIETLLEGVVGKQADHEERIRSLERSRAESRAHAQRAEP